MSRSKQKNQSDSKPRNLLHIVFSIVGILFCVILIPILVTNIALIIKSYTQPDEVPSFVGYTPLIIQSGSMEPAIHVGDLVLVKKADAETLQAGETDGDIIAFRYTSNDSVIIHRIVAADNTGDSLLFTTKGDANNTVDCEQVQANQIVGIHVLRLQGLGDFAMFLQTPLGIICILLLPIAAFILYDTLRRRRYARQKKAQSQSLEAQVQALKDQLDEMTEDPPKPPAPKKRDRHDERQDE